MKRWTVNVPIVGWASVEVEAETYEEALDKGLESDWKDDDVQELFSIRKVCEGNVCHHPYREIDAIEEKK